MTAKHVKFAISLKTSIFNLLLKESYNTINCVVILFSKRVSFIVGGFLNTYFSECLHKENVTDMTMLQLSVTDMRIRLLRGKISKATVTTPTSIRSTLTLFNPFTVRWFVLPDTWYKAAYHNVEQLAGVQCWWQCQGYDLTRDGNVVMYCSVHADSTFRLILMLQAQQIALYSDQQIFF